MRIDFEFFVKNKFPLQRKLNVFFFQEPKCTPYVLDMW